jgi:hypothetical protein
MSYQQYLNNPRLWDYLKLRLPGDVVIGQIIEISGHWHVNADYVYCVTTTAVRVVYVWRSQMEPLIDDWIENWTAFEKLICAS